MIRYTELQSILHAMSGVEVPYNLFSKDGQQLYQWFSTYRMANKGTAPPMELLMSKLGVKELPPLADWDEIREQIVENYVSENMDRMFEEVAKRDGGHMDTMAFLRQGLDNIAKEISTASQAYYLTKYEERLEQYKQDILSQKTRRVASWGDGWAKLDDYTNGVEDKDMIYVYARWSEGKSTFARQWAINFARQGKKVLMISLEEDAETVMMLLESMWLRLENSKDYIRRQIGPLDLKKIGEGLASLKSLEGEIIVTNELPGGKLTGIVDLINQHQPDICILDQLTLAADSPDWKDFTVATRMGKKISMKACPQIWLTQASKTGSIGYSDSAGQDADKVIYITPTPEKNGEYKSIKGFKNRRGQKGWEIPVDFQPERGIVQELYTDRAPAANWADVRNKKEDQDGDGSTASA